MKNQLIILLAALSVSGCMESSHEGHGDKHDQHGEKQVTESTGEKKTAANTDGKMANHPGAKVYKTACMACHVSQGKPTIAPPIFAVKDHVIKQYPERDAFTKRIVEWVKKPDANDVLMPGAIKKFGLMPALATMSDEDLTAVSEFIYESDLSKPDWYQEHYEAEHGKQ